MRRTRSLRALVLLAAFGGALAIAPTAGAAVSCNFTTDQVNIQMTTAGDIAMMEIGGGGVILVDSASGPIICGPAGPPTVANTDRVVVADTSDDAGTPEPTDGSTTVEVVAPSDFVPGATLTGENGGLGEIEFSLYMNEGHDDTLNLVGADPGADDWEIGTGGINWNAGAGDSAPDAELTTFPGLDRWSFLSRGGADRINARGGTGTGAPFAGRIDAFAGAGNDVIDDGDGPGDNLEGGAGDDIVRGFGGSDDIVGGPGDDVQSGGADEDFLFHEGLPAGVTVDLSRPGPQSTGGAGIDTITGIEDMGGTTHADTLTGNGEANFLFGSEGDDVFDGGPGDDGISGGDGDDTVTYARAPTGVTVDLTAFRATGYGTDDIENVENVIGSEFADRLSGDAEANSITGLAGFDTISALAGADTVDVRDGEADDASCGSELDTVRADGEKLDIVNPDCETVDYLADTEVRLNLSGKARQPVAKRKGVVVTASCPLEDCVLKATARGKLRGAKGSVKVKTKPVSEDLAGGVKQRLKLRLTRPSLKSLKNAASAGQPLKLKVKATASDTAGNSDTDKLVVKARR